MNSFLCCFMINFVFGSGHCQELAPKYREAASILATADLPRPVVLAKYDDSTDSQRRLRGGAEDGNLYYEKNSSKVQRFLMLNPFQFLTTMPIRPSLSLKMASTQNIQGVERLKILLCICPLYRKDSIRMTKRPN